MATRETEQPKSKTEKLPYMVRTLGYYAIISTDELEQETEYKFHKQQVENGLDPEDCLRDSEEKLKSIANPETYRAMLRETFYVTHEKTNSDEFRDRANSMLAGLGDVEELNKILGLPNQSAGEILPYTAILSANEREAGDHYITTEQFRDFLRWYNHNITQLHIRLNEQLPEMKGDFVRRVTKAISEGKLPKNAMSLSVLKKLDRVTYVHIDDELDLIDKNEIDTAARTIKNSYSITVTPDYADDAHAINHEIGHHTEGIITHDDAKDDFPRNEFEAANLRCSLAEADKDDATRQLHLRGIINMIRTIDPENNRANNIAETVRVFQEGLCELLAQIISDPDSPGSYPSETTFIQDISRLSEIPLVDFFENMYFTDDVDVFVEFFNKLRAALLPKDILRIGAVVRKMERQKK